MARAGLVDALAAGVACEVLGEPVKTAFTVAAIARRTMRGKSCVGPGEFQHGRGDGVASLPQASRLAGFSEKSGQIRGVLKMCVIGHHVHRARTR